MELKKTTQIAWRRFLSSEAGTEGLLFLRERVPAIIKGPSEQMLHDGGRATGYTEAINELSTLIATPPAKEESAENKGLES